MNTLIVPIHALMLSQMLRPTRQEEPLEPDTGLGGMLIDAPAMRTVAVAFSRQYVDRLQKIFRIPLICRRRVQRDNTPGGTRVVNPAANV